LSRVIQQRHGNNFQTEHSLCRPPRIVTPMYSVQVPPIAPL
jgi:hypothetical protein